MNEGRIAEAARQIARRKDALRWLQEHGEKITSARDMNATVTVTFNYAHACPGAKEAAEIVSAYGRFSLPAMVRDAMACCRNEIAMAKDAIREELEKSDIDGECTPEHKEGI